VSFSLLLGKVGEHAQGRIGSTLPVLYRRNGAIERPADGVIVMRRERLQSSWLLPGYSRFDDASRRKELRQQLLQPGPDGAGPIMLLAQQPRGHDDVGINGPQRHPQLLGGANSPPLSFAQRIFVANYDRWADLFTKLY